MNKKFAGITIHKVVENYSDTLIRVAYQNTKNISDSVRLNAYVIYTNWNWEDPIR